jgi:hypothetical protein
MKFNPSLHLGGLFRHSLLALSPAKKLFLSAIFLFLVLHSNGNIKTATGNAGPGWTNASNWNPSGVPQNGDTVIIPSGVTISIKGQIYSFPYPTIVIKIFGALDLDPSGKLDLSSASTMGIFNSAHLTTNGTNTEIITIGGVSKFNGHIDGDLSGPKYASAVTGVSPNGFFPGVLPIRLLSFNYKVIDHKVDIIWTVEQESDQDKYEVQRSANSENWEVISTLSPRGMAGEILSYTFEDAPAVNKIIFYRLNLKSIDGTNKYSKILAVDLQNTSPDFTIFPNPARSSATLRWNDMNEKEITINVVDNSGKMVMAKPLTAGNFASLDVSGLSNGIYNVRFLINKKIKSSAKIVVKK